MTFYSQYFSYRGKSLPQIHSTHWTGSGWMTDWQLNFLISDAQTLTLVIQRQISLWEERTQEFLTTPGWSSLVKNRDVPDNIRREILPPFDCWLSRGLRELLFAVKNIFRIINHGDNRSLLKERNWSVVEENWYTSSNTHLWKDLMAEEVRVSY